MTLPVVLAVDDDVAVSQAITRDLRSRYGEHFRIVRSTSGAEALEALEEFARRDQPIALIVSDHRMPGMTGIEFLDRSKQWANGAKLVLLTAYADTDVAIRAINDIGLDHYLMKPWAPPDERLYPVIDELLDDWNRANRDRFEGVRIVGTKWSEACHETVHAVVFDDGSDIEARAVLIATGVSYRLLEAPGLAELTGRGVFYGASASDAPATAGEDVYVVGAANSAGQATLHLAKYARRVIMLVRGNSLEASMSRYLIDRIRAAENIEVRLQTAIVSGAGVDHLEKLTILDGATGVEETVSANWLYTFIGASPRTDWLGDCIARDAKGFILTGPEVTALQAEQQRWPLRRDPFLLETSTPGVFAAGDVRLTSMKRVASAVGDGSSAVSMVFRYLDTV